MVWSPDRELNPQYEGIPDIDPCGIIHRHPRPDNGEPCEGGITLDLPGVREVFGERHPLWTVVSLEPLHLEPSLLCRACGSHGFIREGRWVQA